MKKKSQVKKMNPNNIQLLGFQSGGVVVFEHEVEIDVLLLPDVQVNGSIGHQHRLHLTFPSLLELQAHRLHQ